MRNARAVVEEVFRRIIETPGNAESGISDATKYLDRVIQDERNEVYRKCGVDIGDINRWDQLTAMQRLGSLR